MTIITNPPLDFDLLITLPPGFSIVPPPHLPRFGNNKCNLPTRKSAMFIKPSISNLKFDDC
jgi:hypothetical protein